MPLNMGSANFFSEKGHIINIIGFEPHTVCITNTINSAFVV